MVRINVQRKWIMAFPETDAEREIARQIPCWVAKAKWAKPGAFVYPKTLAIGLRLSRAFPDGARFEGAGAAELQSWFAEYRRARGALKAETTLPDVPGERVVSWPHQRRGFWFASSMPSFLLSEKVGFGKTKQFIDVVCHAEAKRVFVGTTASAVGDWPEHMRKHATRDFHVLALDERAGTAMDKAEEIRAALLNDRPLLVVLSHDTAYRPPLGPDGKGDGLLCAAVWDFVFVDEIHAISSPNGRRSNFFAKLGKSAIRRGGATGSIVRHKPEDIWGPFRFLDEGVFGSSFTTFKERYCEFNVPSRESEIKRAHDAQAEIKRRQVAGELIDQDLERAAVLPPPRPRFVVGYKNLDEMRKLLHSITYHVEGRLVDVPEPREMIRRCYLPADAQTHYDNIEREFVTELNDGTIVDAVNVLARLIRLQQLTSGFLGETNADEETGKRRAPIIHPVHDAKEKLLANVLEEIGHDEKVVVACLYRADLDAVARVATALDRPIYEHSGGKKQFRDFVAHQSFTGAILSGQVQSICEAIDLTCSAYLVCYSLGFSLYQYVQLIGRLDRPGQKRSPTVIHLAAAGTIDERKHKAYVARQEIADYLLSDYGAGGETVSRLRRALVTR